MTFTTGHTQYSVYALIDPRDNRIRYIGIAVGVQKRYYEHLHGLCNRYVRQWIKELQGIGLCPALHILEIVNRQTGTSFDEFMRIVCDREAHLIEMHARLGAPLLNRDGITKKYRKAFGKQHRLTRQEITPAIEMSFQEVPAAKVGSSRIGFPSMRLEDFRIDVAKLTRQELSVLSNVSVSTIQRAEEGQSISKLMIARILDGLSKHLGREVKRSEIDEFE
ncbi:MAG: hypothetical protein M3Z24_17050 [Chloroflexota bacterium]|nr:hypothetical protein [Chloroflexota bacterium]